MTSTTSYFLEDRSQPLVNQNPATLNHRLLTEHIDVPDDDQSLQANLTRRVAHVVGSIFTPKQVLAILRVLKAISLCFIVLTILADIMYILFVELFASKEVKELAGGNRDVFIRLYGLGLSFVALAIEIDHVKIVKRFSGLKPFIPRALLYLFIAVITASHPLTVAQEEYYSNNDDASNNDATNTQGDDNANDDASSSSSSYYTTTVKTHDINDEIPSSAVGFMMVSSFVLGICAVAYLICGLLCFDRFTALAFISTKDPRVTTAIQASNSPENPVDGNYHQADDDNSGSTRQSDPATWN